MLFVRFLWLGRGFIGFDVLNRYFMDKHPSSGPRMTDSLLPATVLLLPEVAYQAFSTRTFRASAFTYGIAYATMLAEFRRAFLVQPFLFNKGRRHGHMYGL